VNRSQPELPFCPDCESAPHADVASPAGEIGRHDRRQFLRWVGSGAAAAVIAGSVPAGMRAAEQAPAAAAGAAPAARPAEGLVRELFAGLSADQKKELVLPFDHGATATAPATRLRMYNRPVGKAIGDVYTQAQQELIEKIVRAMGNGEDGWRLISRGGKWDNSGSLAGCGANIFGDPSAEKGKFAFLFTGHHLTIRCDGDSLEGAAFGGPVYYGHSPNGYSDRNVFFPQTKAALTVYDAFSAEQAKKAVVDGTPGEHEPSVRLRPKADSRPGIAYAELTADQKKLVEDVMRNILSPFRKEDGDEVMAIIKETGGMDRMHLAFYRDAKMKDDKKWHFWRLEGPGFVWNFRVLPHVHCYVNIAARA
jgi:hypothetical protein